MVKNKKSSDNSHQEVQSFSELAKKIVFASLGSAMIAKDAMKESKLPRDVLSNLIEKAEKRKEDFFEMIAKEVSKFLSKINVSEELSKTLSELSINLNIDINFEPKNRSNKLSPKIKLKSGKVSKK